jgi:predicted patatin/cPLA2 family phospholipase
VSVRALSLPGCGCRGAFQFGVLARLVAAGERFDVAAGASSGSIAAAAYAAGRSTEGPAIYRALAGTPVFSARWLRRERSFFGMSHIVRAALEAHLPERAIADSPVELLVSTTPLPELVRTLQGRRGRAVVHSSRDRRDLHDVLLASCTFPPFYARVVRLDGEVHLDGGATDNHLIHELVRRGARHVTVITPHPGGLVYAGLGHAPAPLAPIPGVELRVISPTRRLRVRSFDFDPHRLAEALEMPHREVRIGP